MKLKNKPVRKLDGTKISGGISQKKLELLTRRKSYLRRKE